MTSLHGALSVEEAEGHLRAASAVAGIDAADFSVPESRQVVGDGVRINCLDWGPGPEPALLCLHGGWLTAHSWDLVCLALRDRYHAIAVDQRGHGDSDWSPTLDYAAASHANDIAAVIEALELEAPILLGQSMGGINALTYAAREDAELAALVVVDTGPTISWDGGVERTATFIRDGGTFGSIEEIVDHALTFNSRRDPELLRTSLRHNLRRTDDGRWMWKYDRRAIPERMEAMRLDVEAVDRLLNRIACPVLVVRGADSDVFDMDDMRYLVDALADAEGVSIADAGHTVQGDNPRDLAAAIGAFAERIAARR